MLPVKRPRYRDDFDDVDPRGEGEEELESPEEKEQKEYYKNWRNKRGFRPQSKPMIDGMIDRHVTKESEDIVEPVAKAVDNIKVIKTPYGDGRIEIPFGFSPEPWLKATDLEAIKNGGTRPARSSEEQNLEVRREGENVIVIYGDKEYATTAQDFDSKLAMAISTPSTPITSGPKNNFGMGDWDDNMSDEDMQRRSDRKMMGGRDNRIPQANKFNTQKRQLSAWETRRNG